ncbi:MAG: hypothetical protein HZC36_09345 [Armatimonadetes bacterium]|nr:hypothetical protein [Armatimonadota bacterium]
MPRAMDGLRVGLVTLLAWIAAGCGSSPPPPYPQWSPAPSAEGATGRFAEYQRAAEEAERAAGKLGGRVNFTPGMKRELRNRLAPSMARVTQTASDGSFGFVARGPFESAPHQKGWWLLGQAFSWRIEAAVAREDYERAVQDALAATRFGFSLSAGSATDAGLGFTIVDRARRALAPALPRMGAGQLQSLAAGLGAILEQRPSMAATAANERLNMLAAVQTVQDLYRDQNLKALTRSLGPDVSDAVTYLEQLRPKDASKRPAYFEGFAAEAEQVSAWNAKIAPLDAAARKEQGDPPLGEHRPWRRLARHFFGAMKPLFSMRDATLARTRMLALEALIHKSLKVTGTAPKDLSGFPESIVEDPYTGRTLAYRAEGADYRLYSVGEDLKDDGGETNDTYSSPDLRVEAD